MGIDRIGLGADSIAGYKTQNISKNNNSKADAKGFQDVLSTNTHTSIVYMKTDDMLYSGGNGTGLSFYIKYAAGSTDDDPTVIAKGVDENGDEFEQTIHINEINCKNASVVEMHALEAYMGVDKNGGLTSLPPESGAMGLHDRADFDEMFEKQIKDMKLLSQKNLAEYYYYSMQAYRNFAISKNSSK